MKNILILFLCLACSFSSFAQGELSENELYLTFEWMQVDGEQWADYMDTEDFWSGIHQQRVNAGEILGWDLWSVLPGGEKQGSQYLVVTLYSSFAGMLKSGASNLGKHAQAAYPDMSEEDLMKMFQMTPKTRDLAYRVFLKQIDYTKDDFGMPIGTVATLDAMMANHEDYEKMESKIFKPWHQQQVDAGTKGSWGLMRVLLPTGSEAYASHATVNMYKDMDHFANSTMGPGEMDMVTSLGAEAGIEMREMKSLSILTLLKKVRPAIK